MRLLRSAIVSVALFGMASAAVAGPVSVNVVLSSQMVEPSPSPGTLTLPSTQPGDLLLDPGGEVLLGTVRFAPRDGVPVNPPYSAETPFSVFVKVTDSASGQDTTFRVDGTAVDIWLAGQDGPPVNTHHLIDLTAGGWTDQNPFTQQTVLGGNAYTLRVDRGPGGTSADFVLSVGPASAVPEPATLLLAGVALLPVGLRALRRRG